MNKPVCFLLALLTLLAGCASTSTLMVNDGGQFADCATWGAGAFGAAMALVRTQECANEYKAAGYKETGLPPVIGPQAAQDVAQSTGAMQSSDGSFKMIMPAGWIQIAPPTAAYQLYARNPAMDSAVLISSVERGRTQDWEAQVQSLRATLADSLASSASANVEKIRVNGFDALRTEIGGELKNGAKLRYLGTAINAERALVWIVAWCDASRFDANRAELEKLAAGFQF